MSTKAQHSTFCYSAVKLDEDAAEFRLLELRPSINPGDDVTCRIFVSNVKKPPPFKALSYTWGNGSKTQFITLVGADGKQCSVLPITASLDTALRHLRHEHDPVTLWIDQICINQDCYAEKGQQVGLMGSIYSGAEQVLVWLGAAENDSDSLMETWQTVGQAARDFGMEGYYTKERWPLLFRIMNNIDPSDPKTIEYQSLLWTAAESFAPLIAARTLHHWFARPWFTRAWVTQEFCLCPSTLFVCGARTIPVELVMLAIQILHSSLAHLTPTFYTPRQIPLSLLDPLTDEPTARLFSCRARRRKYDSPLDHPDAKGDTLLALLKKLYVDHSTAATLHRDRIFALLALAVDSQHLNLTPDYSHPHCPRMTAQTLTRAARAMITNPVTGRVDVLCYAQFPKAPAEVAGYLPSWAPDWRSGLAKSFYEVNEAVGEHVFAACGGEMGVRVCRYVSKKGKEEEEDEGLLGLGGWVVDVVEGVADEVWGDMSWDAARFVGYLRGVGGLVERGLRKVRERDGGGGGRRGGGGKRREGKVYRTREKLEEARWRVPIGALYWTPETSMQRATDEVAVYHQQCFEAVEFLDECGRLSDEEQVTRFEEFGWEEKSREGRLGGHYRESMKYMIGKRPFLTRNGYVGMGPADVAAGDVVVVFSGGRIPFVLRPLKSEVVAGSRQRREMFRFVGEAYCDGVMDGEVVTSKRTRDFFMR